MRGWRCDRGLLIPLRIGGENAFARLSCPPERPGMSKTNGALRERAFPLQERCERRTVESVFAGKLFLDEEILNTRQEHLAKQRHRAQPVARNDRQTHLEADRRADDVRLPLLNLPA